MDTVDALKIIWVGAFVLFVAMEIAMPGFIMLPFALGALVTAVFALFEVNIGVQLGIFLVSSTIFFFALRPLGKRLNSFKTPSGIGANRLVGEAGVVIEPITGETGLIRVEGEEWRAETLDGTSLAAGAPVRVIEVRGTRVLVEPRELGHPTEGALS